MIGTARVSISAILSKFRNLIVEDEPGIAHTLHYLLAADGFAPH